MGIFDNIMKIISGGSKAAKTGSGAKNSFEVSKEKSKKKKEAKAKDQAQKQSAAERAAQMEARKKKWAEWEEKTNAIQATLPEDIREILTTEFSQYELLENQPVTTIDSEQAFGDNINYVLAKDGKPVAAIMIVARGKKRTKAVHGVELACANKGVAFANFHAQFNNADFPFSRELAVKYLTRVIK